MKNSNSAPSWQRITGANKNFFIDPLSIIYNEEQWKVYKVSPLFHLMYEAVRLKQYSSKIRQTIVSQVSASSSLKYTVTVNPEPDLKYTEDDPQGLNITVTCSTQELNSKTKLAYSAVLLSWGVSNSIGDNTVHLPYMLERGEQKIGASVRYSLQILFDCNIKQFTFSQQQILGLGLNFLEFDMSQEREQFVLVFKNRAELKGKLTFSFDIGDMRIFWNGAKDETTNPSELLCLAHQIIRDQIFHMVTLDITAFDLAEVLLPKGEVKTNGVVKMKTAEIVNAVFMMLNDICDLTLPELNSTKS